MSAVTHKSRTAKQIPRPITTRKDDFVPLDGLLTLEQWAALPEVKPYELINEVLVRKWSLPMHTIGLRVRFCPLAIHGAIPAAGVFCSQGAATKIDNFNGFVPDVITRSSRRTGTAVVLT